MRNPGMKCQALDFGGRRCRSTHRLVAVSYFGDHEHYGWDGPEPQWVRVMLCDKHRERPPARRRKTP